MKVSEQKGLIKLIEDLWPGDVTPAKQAVYLSRLERFHADTLCKVLDELAATEKMRPTPDKIAQSACTLLRETTSTNGHVNKSSCLWCDSRQFVTVNLYVLPVAKTVMNGQIPDDSKIPAPGKGLMAIHPDIGKAIAEKRECHLWCHHCQEPDKGLFFLPGFSIKSFEQNYKDFYELESEWDIAFISRCLDPDPPPIVRKSLREILAETPELTEGSVFMQNLFGKITAEDRSTTPNT